MIIERETDSFKAYVDFLKLNKFNYKIHHGTYTTKVETDMGVTKYPTTSFSNRVFIAANKIRKDVLQSEYAQDILTSTFERHNYDNDQTISDYWADSLFNIDISGAYASCLYLSGLITHETYAYLNRLAKDERLPACGMLAKSHTTWTYENGECTNVEVVRAATAPVFYYLIAEVNNAMQACKWELGKDFLFYWVDGIFFKPDTSKRKVKKVEQILSDRGYRYKYEKVEKFNLYKRNNVYVVDMVKNDIQKHYEFQDSQIGKDLAYIINEQTKRNSHRIHS